MRQKAGTVLCLFGLALSVSTLSGCEDETLVSRKNNCDLYAKVGALEGNQTDRCMSNKEVYIHAATNYTKAVVDGIAPSLAHSKASLSSQLLQIDRSSFAPLPPDLKFPIFIEEKDKHKNWKFSLHMKNLIFSAPSLSDEQLGWNVSGNQSLDGSFATFPLDGIPPNSLEGLDDACLPYLDSMDFSGCEAEVYVDISKKDNVFSELIVVAMDFHPPSNEQLTAKLFEHELNDWTPSTKK